MSPLKAISDQTETNEIQVNIINKVNSHCKVFLLIWVPGHSSIHGNQQAGMLARSAAEFEGAWNLRRDLQSCLSDIKSSGELLWQSHWDNLHHQIHSKRVGFLQSPHKAEGGSLLTPQDGLHPPHLHAPLYGKHLPTTLSHM